MEKIRDRDINVTRHAADGFTLSCVTGTGACYRKRYMGYSVTEAKRRFREYVLGEGNKALRLMTREDVLLGALKCVCGGSVSAARGLLGDS
jgi:hypothetical protein